jgi:hypothetical protein
VCVDRRLKKENEKNGIFDDDGKLEDLINGNDETGNFHRRK